MKKIILIYVVFKSFIACCQTDTTNLVKYSVDFEFTDGVYISFLQVKENKPVRPERIISDINPESFDYYNELMKNNKIYFIDDFGVKQSVETKTIWGYARSGTLYINYNNTFNRIPVVGTISHFVADVTVIRERMADPFYYNNFYSPLNSTYTTREMRQYLLDFKSGKIYPYNLQSVEVLLMQDPEIYDEFNQLKRKKKKKLLFFYIRKFNERNPLYVVKN